MKFRVNSGAATVLVAVLAMAMACMRTPTDQQLTQRIQSKFSQDSGLQGKAISVETAAGVVTLSGNVDNQAQRVAAARYASTTPGIKEVVNNLEVGPSSTRASMGQSAKPMVPAKPQAKSKNRSTAAQSKNSKRAKKDPSEWDTADASSNTANDSDSSNTQAANAAPADSQPPAPPPLPATPPPPPPKLLTIQSGTTIAIRLVDAVDSETSQQGQTFRATLDSPISSNGEVAIPAGYKVEGHVVDVKSAGKFAGQSLLVLQLDRVSAGGKSYNLQTDQYRRQGNNRSTNTAEKVGAGAVIGAIIGGIAGGGKGAGIGAAAGGGVGGGVQAATKGQQIKLPSESVLNFTLQSPLTVTQVEKGPEAGRPKLDSPQ
jgi:BON domain